MTSKKRKVVNKGEQASAWQLFAGPYALQVLDEYHDEPGDHFMVGGFPVGRVLRNLRLKGTPRVSKKSAVYMCAVLSTITKRAMYLSAEMANDFDRKRIKPRHIYCAMEEDTDLGKLKQDINFAIAESGVAYCDDQDDAICLPAAFTANKRNKKDKKDFTMPGEVRLNRHTGNPFFDELEFEKGYIISGRLTEVGAAIINKRNRVKVIKQKSKKEEAELEVAEEALAEEDIPSSVLFKDTATHYDAGVIAGAGYVSTTASLKKTFKTNSKLQFASRNAAFYVQRALSNSKLEELWESSSCADTNWTWKAENGTLMNRNDNGMKEFYKHYLGKAENRVVFTMKARKDTKSAFIVATVNQRTDLSKRYGEGGINTVMLDLYCGGEKQYGINPHMLLAFAAGFFSSSNVQMDMESGMTLSDGSEQSVEALERKYDRTMLKECKFKKFTEDGMLSYFKARK